MKACLRAVLATSFHSAFEVQKIITLKDTMTIILQTIQYLGQE